MDKHLLQNLFKGLKADIPFIVQYWDGTKEHFGRGNALLSIIFKEKVSISRFLKEPSMAFGEAYMNGEIVIEGRIEHLINLAYANKKKLWTQSLQLLKGFTSLSREKRNIQHHYDIGNEFYSLWLDETMSYSCAYFQTEEDSLHQAQIQKIDHVLKKLQLKKGERLLDIGSGWGWLIIRAAERYGVRAHGITLSEQQYRKTKERIKSLGLEGQVEVDLLDYREFSKKGLVFDKIASVGMFEHVGQKNYPAFMESVHSSLKDGGVALLHTITRLQEQPVDPWIEKYIFPGGHIPSFREIIGLFPEHTFHVLDVENLRLHYAKTLDHWSERFEAQIEEIQKMYDERFVRMWRLYLQSSAAFFRNGGLHIHQILFSKGINNGLMLTRDHLYQQKN